jgi:hypothetical protein
MCRIFFLEFATMNRKMLKLILGIIAMSAFGAANAAVVNLTTSPSGPTLSGGDLGVIPFTVQSSGFFTDNFYFTLAPTASKLDSNVTNIALAGFGFTSLTAKLFNYTTSTAVPGGTGLNFSLSSHTGGDTYDLQVSGTPWTTAGGIFSGAVRVVPIPAAAWLLISGLAGIGAMARRRKSEAAS